MRLASRRRRLLVSLLLVAVAWAATCVAFPSAFGGFSPTITNSTNTAAIGTTSTTTCLAAAQGTSSANAFFVYPFNETYNAGNNTAYDQSGNQRNGTYQNQTSGEFGVANSGAGAVCPRDNKTVIALNGTSQYISGPLAGQTSPNTFTIQTWFRTSFPQGVLIGFGDHIIGPSASIFDDRHLYINGSGNLVFGIYPGSGRITIASAVTVTDGNWHLATATLSSAGMVLYLDGAQVASNMSATTGGSYFGFWKIGYDDLTGWAGAPSSGYFRGNLAFASESLFAMTSTQVAAQYAAGR